MGHGAAAAVALKIALITTLYRLASPALKGKRRCRTPEGRERSKRARWKHGSYSVEAESEFWRLKAEYV